MTQAAPNLPPPPVPNPPPTPPAPPAPTPSPTPTPTRPTRRRRPLPPPTPCTGTVSPGQRSFTFLGGSGTVQVSASAATCSWTATSSRSWLTITSGAAGMGNGDSRLSCPAKPHREPTRSDDHDCECRTPGDAERRADGQYRIRGLAQRTQRKLSCAAFHGAGHDGYGPTKAPISVVGNVPTSGTASGSRLVVCFRADGTLLARRVEIDTTKHAHPTRLRWPSCLA